MKKNNKFDDSNGGGTRTKHLPRLACPRGRNLEVQGGHHGSYVLKALIRLVGFASSNTGARAPRLPVHHLHTQSPGQNDAQWTSRIHQCHHLQPH